MKRPGKPAKTISKARALRRDMSLPERLLWQYLRGAPQGLRFRRQHPAGVYVLDFFCARANLAIEVDGATHAAQDRKARDAVRDDWMRDHRIHTLRIPASAVLADVQTVAEGIIALSLERMGSFGKATPSDTHASATSPPSDTYASATSPSQVDGENKEEP